MLSEAVGALLQSKYSGGDDGSEWHSCVVKAPEGSRVALLCVAEDRFDPRGPDITVVHGRVGPTRAVSPIGRAYTCPHAVVLCRCQGLTPVH